MLLHAPSVNQWLDRRLSFEMISGAVGGNLRDEEHAVLVLHLREQFEHFLVRLAVDEQYRVGRDGHLA